MNRYLTDAASAYLRIPRHTIVKVRRDDATNEAVVIYGPTLIKRRIPLAELESRSLRPDSIEITSMTSADVETTMVYASEDVKEPEPEIPNRRALQRMRRGALVELATALGLSNPDDMKKRQLIDDLEKWSS